MGLYLCEFIFYVSMAESQRTQQDAIVLFVHLPPEGDPYSLQQDREILRAIIDWVVTHY
ncbi:hypothetical protein BC937DRAFT_94437 [Endogone sp. FLAS-F59071]|nr:hypothetical protein BC937DRAFT_94437 [Endogone sp. FLAS-F59071]|eukprot:RUS14036.1 hypothetical protein BC937DRAFT_94437 [Endogone sp. FLAS-F59071]